MERGRPGPPLPTAAAELRLRRRKAVIPRSDARAAGSATRNLPGFNRMLIGVISDTHGLLRPEAVAALEGADQIIHAGDVGKAIILDELRAVAPLRVIRGNVDRDLWTLKIPDTLIVEAAGKRIYVIHNLDDYRADPEHPVDVVISGHSHKPSVQRREGVLYLNPGSAGPRRFRLPITLAHLRIDNDNVSAEIIPLLS